jgi:hypothetical protein
MMPVESWEDPYERVLVEDHCDPAQILHDAESERMLTVGDHPVIRNLYRRSHSAVLRSAISCQKVIKGKRRHLRNLMIRNYEPPKIPLHAHVAGRVHPMDLFGLAASSQVRG